MPIKQVDFRRAMFGGDEGSEHAKTAMIRNPDASRNSRYQNIDCSTANCVDLSADFLATGFSTSYAVSSIPFNPPVAFDSGTEITPLLANTLADLYYDLADNIKITFSRDNFIQVNHQVNKAMIAQALQWLNITEQDTVLDLFCGLGNFSLPIAFLYVPQRCSIKRLLTQILCKNICISIFV